MKTFKGYISERAPAWAESLSTMLFDLPRAGLKDAKIPLSPSIFKRIWPKSIRSRVFHVTDLVGVQKLKKMQGGKSSISAFYNIAPARISYGIQTEGGYIAEMDADVLIAGADDIASQPDKTGRRWITWSTVIELGGVLGGMERDIEEMMIDIIMEYAEDPGALGMPNVNKSWTGLGREFNQFRDGGKTKSLIIRDYIDGMEKIMKKYSKRFRTLFTEYVKERDLDPTISHIEWDELVVNNFKIKMIHVGEEYAEDFEGEDALDMYGLPFRTWEDDGDLTDYITKTVQRMK